MPSKKYIIKGLLKKNLSLLSVFWYFHKFYIEDALYSIPRTNLTAIYKKSVALLLVVLLLIPTGCTVGSKYTPPVIDAPTSWKNNTSDSDACYKDDWWEVFDDPDLNALEQQVLAKNQDLKVAAIRVQEARALMNV